MVLPNDTFRIRDAHPEETNDVVGVITEAYREYMPFIPAPFVDAFRKDAVAVQDRSEYTELIVAERGSQIVGTVTFYPDGSRYGPGLPDGSAAFRRGRRCGWPSGAGRPDLS